MPSIQKVTNAYCTYFPNRGQQSLDKYDDARSETVTRDKKTKKSFKEVLTEIEKRSPLRNR